MTKMMSQSRLKTQKVMLQEKQVFIETFSYAIYILLNIGSKTKYRISFNIPRAYLKSKL